MEFSKQQVQEIIRRVEMLIAQKNMKKKDFYSASGVSSSLYSQYNTGRTRPSLTSVAGMANALDVSLETLIDNLPKSESGGQMFQYPSVAEDTVSFPVIGGVAAGYDHIAYEDWTGDSIEIPRSYLKGKQPQDYFVLRVQGDSMYPDFQDGDHVLILRQSTMDRSGQVGVVIYDDESSTLKRIEYVMGEDWMTLRPINPQYPPVTIRDESLEHCKVLGVAKMVIRELNQ